MVVALTACTIPQLARSNLETRIYLVDEIFWLALEPPDSDSDGHFIDTSDESESLESALQNFLIAAGVPFPDGAFIALDRERSHFIAYNTPRNLDNMEAIMQPLCENRPFYEKRIE